MDLQAYSSFANLFGNIASGDSPEQVAQIVDALQYVNAVDNFGGLDALINLMQPMAASRGWYVVAGSHLFAQEMHGGKYVVLYPASLSPGGPALVEGPVPNMRLFALTPGSASHPLAQVAVVNPEEWARRRVVRANYRSQAEFDGPISVQQKLLVAAALGVLNEQAVGMALNEHMERHLTALRRAAARIDSGAGPDTLAEALDSSNGLESASLLIVTVSLALGILPSQVFAEAENRVSNMQS